MFELSISTISEKQHYINEIYEKLNLEIKRDLGISIKYNFGGRSYYSIAVPEDKKEYYKSKIISHIIFMIIDDYKFNYFKENLLLIGQNIISQSFLKAISIFDSEIDGEFIKSQIELKSEILVDSFFYFKLRPLIERWKKTALIINQNQILSSNQSMIEVLKYLTMSSENYLVTAEIFIEKKHIKFKNYLKSKSFKRNFEGYSNFFTEVVRLNPIKINLKTVAGEEQSDVVSLLSQIFTDKLYLIN